MEHNREGDERLAEALDDVPSTLIKTLSEDCWWSFFPKDCFGVLRTYLGACITMFIYNYAPLANCEPATTEQTAVKTSRLRSRRRVFL